MKRALCPECATALKGKDFCSCGWKGDNSTKPTTSNCAQCNAIHNIKYLRLSPDGREICANCMEINKIPPSDREYLRSVAQEHNIPLYDIQTHILAANKLEMTIEEYLPTLPRSREEFKAYWKGKDIKVGNVTL